MSFDPQAYLTEIKNRDPHLGRLIEHLLDSMENVSNHVGVRPIGKTQPPDPHQALNVKAGTDHVHVTITDNSMVRKNVQYFVEWSANDPSFQNAQVEHLGASRGRVLNLPAKDDSNAPISYYFRSYGQYIGSDAQSKKTYFGPNLAPTAVTLAGASKLTPLASPGSGTGRPDGSQPGVGLGVVLQRPPQGPKRPAAPRAR